MAEAFVDVEVIVSERVAKSVGILQVYLVHLEIFVGFRDQSVDFSREIHPLFSRQVAMQLG